MLHDPKHQLHSLVARAATALSLVPDEERAPLLTEMRRIVEVRATAARGAEYGEQFAESFVNAVARMLDED